MNKIKYLNTDLYLESPKSFKKLNDFLNKKDFWALYYGKTNDKWWGSYETCNRPCKTPKKTIEIFLKKLSCMDKTIQKQWDQCNSKKFDIGYECGQKPWAFNDEIPNNIIKKLTELNLGIRITIYPEDKKLITSHSTRPFPRLRRSKGG